MLFDFISPVWYHSQTGSPQVLGLLGEKGFSVTPYNLDDELKNLKAQWRENLDELHLLFALAKEIAFTRNTDLLLDQVVERTAHMMRAEAASLLLMNHETFRLDFKVVKGRSSDAIRNLDIHLRPGEGLAGWVAASGRRVIVNRPQEDPRFMAEVDRLTGFRTRNLIAAPLAAQGKNLGVIEVINRLDGMDFTDHDAAFLEAIADLAALAFENARASQDQESSRARLMSVLESLPGGFIGVDMRKNVTDCNPRAVEILGLPAGVMGQRYTRALASHPVLVEAIDQAFTENQGAQRKTMAVLAPGKGRRSVGYSTLLIRDPEGQTRGVGVLFQDITDLQEGG